MQAQPLGGAVRVFCDHPVPLVLLGSVTSPPELWLLIPTQKETGPLLQGLSRIKVGQDLQDHLAVNSGVVVVLE